MVRAVRTDFEVFLQFLIEDHLTALWALGPEALGISRFLEVPGLTGFFSMAGSTSVGGVTAGSTVSKPSVFLGVSAIGGTMRAKRMMLRFSGRSQAKIKR